MLTPRTRIGLALDHKAPDRIPIGYVATPEVNENLKKFLNIKDDQKLLKRLGVDYRWVTPGYKGPEGLLFEDCWDKPGKDIWGVELESSTPVSLDRTRCERQRRRLPDRCQRT